VPAVWIKIAQCQRQLGDLKGAAECYQAVVDSEPHDLETKLALAEIYERLDERDKALDLVNEGKSHIAR
jgi:general transcription factor 3C polypeptide 3 (transcription factor C subunit 4)